MRLTAPRIEPADESQWDEDSRPVLENLRNLGLVGFNIMKTLANHPKLMKRFLVFGNHVLYRNSLPPRERELLILRTGFVCASGYEWAQHVVVGRAAGLTDDEIKRIPDGPGAPGWSATDRALLRAADEQVETKFISDAVWAELAGTWNVHQLMDLVFTVGQYTVVSMALNIFGVQLEPTTERFPAELFAADGTFPAGG
ncbi:MAG: Carboxymuconolactone decarboxylase family protein [Acidimicrobiales bacterium]|nr:Carboxymuconolactone decarboxylase family protein [Acidimicrobiales bacterium]